jgi:hypothetical protein
MSVAAYTLLAVVITSAIAIAKDLLVESRRDEAENWRIKHRELRDARVACVVIGDEIDTLASNFDLLAKLGRTLNRPIEDSPFPSTREWHAQKASLAYVIDQLDTWKALEGLCHNAESLRTRIVVDGPGTPLPTHRLDELRQAGVDARELSEIVYDAIPKIDQQLAGRTSRSRLGARSK